MTTNDLIPSSLREFEPQKEPITSDGTSSVAESYFISEEEMFEYTSLFCLTGENKFRKFIQKICGKKAFKLVIDVIIIINCFFLVFETIDSLHELTLYSNMVFIGIFTIECIMKIIAYGLIIGQHSYLRDPWNWLDFIVVVTGLVSFIPSIDADLRALRTFRLIRPLKTIAILPNMRMFIQTLVDSLLDLGTVFIMMIFFLMIFAILGLSLWTERFEYLCRTQLLPTNGLLPIDKMYSKQLCGGENTCGGRLDYCLSAKELNRDKIYFFSKAYLNDEELNIKEFNYGLTNFSNILNSMFVLIVVTTLEGWTQVMFMLMDGHNYWISAIYFVLCVIINYYFMFNLIVAVLIYNFTRARTKNMRLNVITSKGSRKKKSIIQVNVSTQNLGEEAMRHKYRSKYEPLIKKKRNKTEVKKLLQKIYDFRSFSCFRNVRRRSNYHKKYYIGYLCYIVIQQPIVQFFFHGLIVFNAIIFSLDRVDITPSEITVLQLSNYINVGCFAFEQFLNINGLGIRVYAKNGLSLLGFFICLSSIIELSLKSYGIYFNNSTASLISAFRMLRLLRFLTFFKGWQSFQIILESIFTAVRRMADFILLFIVFHYMYSLLGYNFFHNSIKYDTESGRFSASELSKPSNFDNFPKSLVSVFLIIIGDHWQELFFDCYRSDINNFLVTIFYFVTLVLFGHLTLMNIFLAYIIDSFENAKKHIEKNVNVRNYIYELIFLCNERTQNSQEPNYFSLLRKHKIDFIENKLINKFMFNKYTGNLISIFDDKMIRKIQQPKIKEMHLIWKRSDYDANKEEFYDFNINYYYNHKKYKNQRNTDIEKNKSMVPCQFIEILNKGSFEKSENIHKKNESEIHVNLLNFSVERLLTEGKELKETKNEDDDNTPKGKNHLTHKKEDTLSTTINKTFSLRNSQEHESDDLNNKKNKKWEYLKGSSFFVFYKESKFRKLVQFIVNSKVFVYVIFILIVIDCICLCLTTPFVDLNSGGGIALKVIDDITNYLFILEALMKMIAQGCIFEHKAYFRSIFNIIDFACVFISVLDFFGIFRQFQYLRTFRTLRSIKPIQLISKSENLSLMASCLIQSIPSIYSLLMFSSILILLSAIIGVGLMKGELQYICTISSIKSKGECLIAGGNWFFYQSNYSNLLYSLKSNFEIMTTENWAKLMYFAIQQKNHIFVYFFFIINLIIGHLFIANLTTALIIQKFQSLKNKRNNYYLLNNTEREWVRVQKILSLFHPTPLSPIDNVSELRQKLTNFIEGKRLEKVIGLLVLLSGMLLIIQHSGASDILNITLEVFNICFIAIFNVEIVLKIIVYGKLYFCSIWNKFDFVIILVCDLFGILYILAIASIIDIKALSVIPIVLRLFRILRILRVISAFGKVRALIDSLLYLVPTIGNVGIIIFILILIYASIGINVFGILPYREFITPNNNFRNFFSSSLLLFQAITKENWNSIMNEISYHDCRDPNSTAYQEDYYCVYFNVTCYDDEYLNYTAITELGMSSCGNNFSYLYFISFILIGPMFMMNLCIVMVIEGFSESMSQNESLLPQDYLEKFVRVWNSYDPECKRLINPYEFVLLLKELQPPLGLNYDKLVTTNYLNQAKNRREYFTFIDLLSQIKNERQDYRRGTTMQAVNELKYVQYINSLPQKYTFKNYYLSRNKKFYTTDTEVFKLVEKLEIIATEENSFHKNKYSYVFTTDNKLKQKEDSELYIHFVEACLGISRYAVSKTQNTSLKTLRRIIVNNYTKSMWALQYDKKDISNFFPQNENDNENKLSKKLAGRMMMRFHDFYKKSVIERCNQKRLSLNVPRFQEIINDIKKENDRLNHSIQNKEEKNNEAITLNNNPYALIPVQSCFNFKSSSNLLIVNSKDENKPKTKGTIKEKIKEFFQNYNKNNNTD